MDCVNQTVARPSGPSKRRQPNRGLARRVTAACGAILFWLAGLTIGATALRAAWPEAEAAFNAGNEAYSKGQFAEAITAYEQALAAGESTALHYNLGNAHFRAQQIGRAVFHYRKALAMDPGHAEARANLLYVQKSAGLAADPAPGPLAAYAKLFSLHLWTWLAAGFFWLSVGLFILPRWWGASGLLPQSLGGFCLLLTMACLTGLAGYRQDLRTAVALAPETSLRITPTPEGTVLSYVPAGETLTIESRHGPFLYTVTPQGKSGWVSSVEAGLVWE